MTTTVQYHSDGYGREARPGINVKCYTSAQVMLPPGFETAYANGTVRLDAIAEEFIEEAYRRIVSDFWQAAEEIATQRGLGEIEQEGRSGGWLVFTDGRDPQDGETFCDGDHEDDEPETIYADHEAAVAAWLADYRAMVEWADAWIADGPRKVAALAQSLAINEAGREPGIRHFGFLLDRGNGSTIMGDDGSTYHIARSGWIERA